MKQLCIFISLLIFLFQSCTHSCEDVPCKYDGICEDGNCVCTDLTENFLIGSWKNVSQTNSTFTFEANNIYADTPDIRKEWSIDPATNTITISPFGEKITVKKEGFSCDQMNVTIVTSLGTNDYTLTRK
jgi:hypothetical protein